MLLSSPAPLALLMSVPSAVPLPGDVVFIGADTGWMGLSARLSAGEAPFGHVGIIASGDGGALVVVHASGSPVARDGVAKTDLSDFISMGTRWQIRRPALPAPIVNGAVALAEEAHAKRLPFDAHFDLQSAEAVYCTELVWRVYSAAYGGDFVPTKSQFFGEQIISLEDLWRSPHLTDAPRPLGAVHMKDHE